MNIYYINPKFFEPSKFYNLLKVLKANVVVNLIKESENINPKDYANLDYYRASCNSYLYDEEWVDAFYYRDLSHLSDDEDYIYTIVSKEICEEFIFPADELPHALSRANDFVGNIMDLDDSNIMLFYDTGFNVSKLAEQIYKRLFDMICSHDYESLIPSVLISSTWPLNMENGLVAVYDINQNAFIENHMEDQSCYDRLRRSDIQEDPLCFLFAPNLSTWDIDEYNQKIELARLLFKEKVISLMEKSIEEEDQYEDEDSDNTGY